MATSVEKVAQAVDQTAAFIDAQLPELLPAMQRQASGLQAVALGAVAPFLPTLLPQLTAQLVAGVRAQLPDEPAALDALLDHAVEHLQRLRSDPPAIDTTGEPA